MPYKTVREYMSWAECRARCPKGAIKQTNRHYCLDLGLCDRCRGLDDYRCGGIFENNSPQQLEDFNAYWQQWFANYQQRLARLSEFHLQGGRS